MTLRHLLNVLALLALTLTHAQTAAVRGWPAVTHETKPWTRWWWQGSAVERESLTAQLQAMREVGLGGVEVTPIYGVRGAEGRFIPYLSAAWVAMLDHTLSEARRLDLGVDMATGTGWPFGGPGVVPSDGIHTMMLKDGRLTGEPTSMPVAVRRTRSRVWIAALL